MRLGNLIQLNDDNPPVGALADRARELEDLGYDGLWVAQAVGRGRMLPDPLLTLAAAAVATTRLRLGTAILQIPHYPTAALAHQVMTLRHLAGDRLVLGVGAGSTTDDFAVYEDEFATRFARFETGLARLRRLLETGRDGDVDLTPWPGMLGGPPLYFGTWGRNVARAATEFDGWIASAMKRTDEQAIEALRRYRAAGGTNAIVSTIVLGPEDEPGRNRRRLEGFAEAGFDEAVVLLAPGGPTAAEVRRWVAS